MILGALVTVAAVWQQVRQRRAQSHYGFDVLPAGWFIAKCATIVAALAAFTLLLASYRGVPVVGIVLAVAFVVYAFVMRSTVFGRQVYAVGGNVAAARLSGVKTKRVTFLVFVNMGLLSALAGLLFAARLNSATRRPASAWNWKPSPRPSSAGHRPTAVWARCSVRSSAVLCSVS